MKVGFIGFGNMARAMAAGMLDKGIVSKEELSASAKTAESREDAAKRFGIKMYADNRDVAKKADILILAVKPQFLEEVIAQIRETVTERKAGQQPLVVSIAAGRTLAWLQERFEGPVRLIRCMPNTPALVGAGCTGVCTGEGVTQEDVQQVMALLQSFGTAEIVSEKLMDVVVGVSGSSPAYVFLFLEAMADEAVAEGMPRAQAYRFAAQAVLGSAKLMLETGKHPGELKDMVCSPGGTTIQAVKVLEEKGLRASVMDAMEACIHRSRTM